MNFKNILEFLKAIFAKWGQDDATRLAASLAFFAVLSLAPLLLVITAIIGLFFGEGAAQDRLVGQAEGIVGPEGAQVFRDILANAAEGGGVTAGIIGFVGALFGASNVFIQLQTSLNKIWEVAPDPKGGIKRTIKKRLFAFAIVLGIGILLLASLLLTVVLTNLEALFNNIPGSALIWQTLEIVIALGIFTLIFAVIFKVIPDVKVEWRDVWVGAAVTAVLFTIGRTLLGLYLGTGAGSSVYGAAGSLMVLLLWIFYSAQILFFGAEFTQVYSKVRGQAIAPDDDAVPLPEERAQKREQIEEHVAKARGEEPGRGAEAKNKAPAPSQRGDKQQQRSRPEANARGHASRAARQSSGPSRRDERKITPLGFVAGAVVVASRLFGKGKDGRTAAKKRRK